MNSYNDIINYIRNVYDMKEDFIPLHAPVFIGNEKKYLNECINSTFVSTVGKFVDKFEEMTKDYTKAKQAVVVVNGTAALHTALKLVGVNPGEEVITQALTFIATANAISYTGSMPVFIDVDKDTMGLSPEKLDNFFKNNCKWVKNPSGLINKITNKRIAACVPMHTFGFPCRIEEIVEVCNKWGVPVVEDAAESLGSYVGNKHTGTFGKIGIISYNGNKTITTGGGGMIITDDEELGIKAKHITTTAKCKHPWEYKHDMIGFNYRMPNINAAIGCAQMESLEIFLAKKRETAKKYMEYFERIDDIKFIKEREGTIANYWLNSLLFQSQENRNTFLEETNKVGVMTRPIWTLMNRLEMYKKCMSDDLSNSKWLEDRIVNIPSGVIL